MMTPDAQGDRHLEGGEVASYLDRVLPPVEDERVEAHLADCAACRDELIEVSRLRRARLARRRWLLFGPVAAAAAIALVVISRFSAPTGSVPVLRDGGLETALTVSLVFPADSGVVERRDVLFTWRSVGEGVSYRLTITDERGDVVWSSVVTDTTARLPSTVALPGARPNFWYVDALLPDGRSVTSGVRRLTAQR